MNEIKLLQRKYGESKNNNFKIIKTISIPHTYMITPKHLEFNDSMYLGNSEILQMENDHGFMCGQSQCNLKYQDHKSGLVIECKIPMTQKNNKNKFNKELHKYLLMIKEKLDLKKYDGFAFVDINGHGAK